MQPVLQCITIHKYSSAESSSHYLVFHLSVLCVSIHSIQYNFCFTACNRQRAVATIRCSIPLQWDAQCAVENNLLCIKQRYAAIDSNKLPLRPLSGVSSFLGEMHCTGALQWGDYLVFHPTLVKCTALGTIVYCSEQCAMHCTGALQ